MTNQQMKVIAQAEHEMFCLRDLLEGSVPAKVMNRAYEYVIKQDLLSVLRETPLTHQQLSVLTPQRQNHFHHFCRRHARRQTFFPAIQCASEASACR